MNKYIATMLIVFCLITTACAQINYLLNPSFEIYDTCPIQGSREIHYAKYWSAVDTTIFEPNCEPAYCNECCANNTASLPMDYAFYNHYPRTGSGCALNGSYSDSVVINYLPYWRTYLLGRLYDALTAGKSYCVTYYIALCQQSPYANNHNDAYFSNGSICSGLNDTNCTYITGFTPQIIEDSIALDTVAGWLNWFDSTYDSTCVYAKTWVKVQGNFIANGTEKFITLGNFSFQDSTLIFKLHNGGGGGQYLIDDVSVVPSDAVADAGPDVAIGRGQSTWIGNDTAAVGGGAGMPCWWFAPGSSTAIDSGGRIQVSPDTTTTYVMMMDLCGNITYDTVTVWVWPLASPIIPINPLNNLTISPNPAKDHVAVNGINKNISYQLTNVLGQEITVGILKVGSSIIDLNNCLPGIYLLTLEDPDDGTKVVKRVVKE